ncbi:hypothetical protein [Crocosphaera sp.]|uniref:hypothetical protein n=1 Tax=Crocosphaera sp. TaxID=2729996 RepID=UPI003F29CE14|nr:hypothetical protein [Crocosphaera sp.]
MSLYNYLFNESIPRGFKLIPSNHYDYIIKYKRTGMGCLNIFLIVFLSSWLIFCILLTWGFLLVPISISLENLRYLIILLGVWSIELGCFLELVKLLFCRKTFYFNQNQLIMKSNILGIQWQEIILKKSIKRVYQVKDGGEDGDTFTSWGLKIAAHDQITLIYRQPYRKSYWLGEFIAQWAGIDFSYYNRKKIKFMSSLLNKSGGSGAESDF